MPNPFILPKIPAELQAIIDADRERFAGWQMMADQAGAAGAGDAGGTGGAAAGGAAAAAGASTDTGAGDNDAELGANGVKTLEKERDRRKALEKEIAGLKAFQTQFTQFVTGLTGGEQATTTEEGLKQLTDQVAALTRENLVERVAREHKIEDEADVELLRAMRSEAEVRALAARLAKAAADDAGDDTRTTRKPRPDPSAGKGGGDAGGKPASVAEVMAARRAAREAKSKTN